MPADSDTVLGAMWYLTIGQRGTSCNHCRDFIPAGEAMYYFHADNGKLILCEECGVIEGISATPSRRLKKVMTDKRRAEIARKRAEREPALF